MSERIPLPPVLCPPDQRITDVTRDEWIANIKWHEQQAERAMQSLHCGSENWEYREAGKVADAHWRAAALMRLHVERGDE